MKRYVFVTGGVLSSLGKGIAAGSIGALFEAQGYTVSFLKLDPYLNIDPGTMNPYQHGEVFVTDDGAETDLDLGHYERFSKATLSKIHSTTAGQLYARLLEKERKGDFLGETVQIVPHFTNEIKGHIDAASWDADVAIIEIGGTVGDIESLPFIEAIRQLGLDTENRCVYVHLTYVPYLETADELKTKPTQHAVKTLLSLGIQPDVIIARSEKPVPDATKKKISLFTNVQHSSIISGHNVRNVYEIPLVYHEQQLDSLLCKQLDLKPNQPDLSQWHVFLKGIYGQHATVKIALVGKYVELRDAYKSIHESLMHAQIPNRVHIDIRSIDSEKVTADNVEQLLNDVDAVLVPGGFGSRGIEGMIQAIKFAREHRVPYFGICLGMQLATIEFARHVLGLDGAGSTEFGDTPFPVIDIMQDQKYIQALGGSMRLGAYECALEPGSRAHALYRSDVIFERHRHRYEFNTEFLPLFERNGMRVTGYFTKLSLPEVIEISDHPFFVGCQFHPEFKSKPFAAHPLFMGFVEAAVTYAQHRVMSSAPVQTRSIEL